MSECEFGVKLLAFGTGRTHERTLGYDDTFLFGHLLQLDTLLLRFVLLLTQSALAFHRHREDTHFTLWFISIMLYNYTQYLALKDIHNLYSSYITVL